MSNGKYKIDYWNTLLVVAGWEFLRHFKWKQYIFALLLGPVIGFIIVLFVIFDKSSEPVVQGTKKTIVVINSSSLVFNISKRQMFHFVTETKDQLPKFQQSLKDGDIEGILNIHSMDEAELTVPDDVDWSYSIKNVLNDLRREQKLDALSVSSKDYEDLQNHFKLNIKLLDNDKKSSTSVIDSAVSLFFSGMMIFIVMMCFAYYLMMITSEKQLKVTEQIVSAIPPVVWIDGKCLGIILLSLSSMLVFLVYGIAFSFFMPLLEGDTLQNLVTAGQTVSATELISSIPDSDWQVDFSINPGVILCSFLFSFLGVVFWNYFFAAIASTIKDPNHSARSQLMLLPILFMLSAFYVQFNPGAALSTFLSYFPLTSMTCMPVRLLESSATMPEAVISLLLLAAGIYLMRLLAAKIFRFGMLMYGKEPSFREMIYWIRQR